MQSISELNTFAKEMLGERLEDSTKKIILELERNQTAIRRGYLTKFNELFQDCIEQQQCGQKGNAAYVHIFYLNSALYTQKYELQLQVFDQMSYLDKSECMALWMPELFAKHFHDDMEWFERVASQQIVGFRYSHMMEIKRKYYTIYLGMIGQFFLREAAQIAELPSYKNMKKVEGIQIIFGGYMDQGIQIWPPLEVQVESG